MDHLVVFALPVFALLIAGEWAYGRRKGRDTYRLADGLSSLSQGLLSQAIAVCTTLFQIGLYSIVFEKLAIWPHASLWDSLFGWVLAVVFFDFCDYWLHRVGHETAVFWAAHSVHHQSEDFNFSTALRQESLVAILGWPFYLPMAIAGVPPEQFAVAGLIVLVYQFWIHTEHIGKLGWFDRVFSSPSNHRVHHAVNPGYINKNYGGMLVVWDRLFGTFAEENEPCVYGTQSPLRSWDPLWAVVHPYALLAHDARHTRRWRDKLRIWFMPTGWRPPDVAERFPRPVFALETASRYDPSVSTGRGVFAAFGFVAAFALTTAMLWEADDLSLRRAAIACAGIAFTLWGVGAVLQGRMNLLAAGCVCTLAAAVACWPLLL
jgi:sterol desaturase/sphingolipid hydroxylase (fatty acid hydroxylase superfamily)